MATKSVADLSADDGPKLISMIVAKALGLPEELQNGLPKDVLDAVRPLPSGSSSNAPVKLSIVLDPINQAIWGECDFGNGECEANSGTTVLAATRFEDPMFVRAHVSQITGIAIFHDFRNGQNGARMGLSCDRFGQKCDRIDHISGKSF